MAKAIDSIDCPVVKNCLFVLTKASGLSPLADKKFGLIRHAIEKLPFPVTLQDFFELRRDGDANSIEVLAKLIRQYPNAFQNTEHASRGLSLLLLGVIYSEWCDRRFDRLKTVNDIRFPRHVKILAHACFYVISQNYTENSAEYRIAFFINFVVENIVTTIIVPMFVEQLVNIICELASGFLQGHFMDINGVKKHLAVLQKVPTEAGVTCAKTK
jgi:hypothetical protein